MIFNVGRKTSGGSTLSYSEESLTLSGVTYYRDLNLTQFDDWENIVKVAVLDFQLVGSIITQGGTSEGMLYLRLSEHTKGNNTIRITALPTAYGFPTNKTWSMKLLILRE